MAHTATKTPTKAAELIIAHNRHFEESLLSIQQALLIKTYQMISHHKDRLVQINQSTINTSRKLLQEHHRSVLQLTGLILTNPKIIVSNRRKDLDNLIGNINSYSRIYFSNKNGYINHFQSIVRMMSPQNILKKGFAMIKINNKIVSNPDSIQEGADLTVHLADTLIETTVKSKSAHDGNEFNI